MVIKRVFITNFFWRYVHMSSQSLETLYLLFNWYILAGMGRHIIGYNYQPDQANLRWVASL